jgi:hypothetical protein
MENKKLIKILTKDMAELEELIAEVKLKRQFDAFEMEFIHTRARGVLQLLQMLNYSEVPVVEKIVEEKIIPERLKEKVEKVATLTSENNRDKSDDEKLEELKQVELKEQALPGVVPEPSNKPEEDLNLEGKDLELKEVAKVQSKDDNDDEALQYEADTPEHASRLGDSFLKGKSVNDLITDQVKLEYKLSNRPVSSIQSSIGINDRFQYIRVLFGGDNKKFLEAVKALDSMDNIRDAVDYLRVNYKWKKNETSLKFVNLVKRRFQDNANG